MNKEPNGPYVYQPRGTTEKGYGETGRIYGVSGVHPLANIDGLTRSEAEAVCDALLKLVATKEGAGAS